MDNGKNIDQEKLEFKIGISASNLNNSESSSSSDEIQIANDEGQIIAYLDLLGVSNWFEENTKNNSEITEKIAAYFGPYLSALWQWHKPIVTKASLHPIGDGAIIVPKIKPSDKDPLKPKEFIMKLSELWLALVNINAGLSPKILITRSSYQTIFLQKNKNDYDPRVDFYSHIVFPGGLAAVRLTKAEKTLPAPSGIYSNLSEFKTHLLTRVFNRLRTGLKREWFAVKIWELMSEESKIKQCMLDKTRKYKDAKRLCEISGLINSWLIKRALQRRR